VRFTSLAAGIWGSGAPRLRDASAAWALLAIVLVSGGLLIASVLLRAANGEG
jgi:hypothetical protein